MAGEAPQFTRLTPREFEDGEVQLTFLPDERMTLSSNEMTFDIVYVENAATYAQGWTWTTATSHNGLVYKDRFADDQSTRLNPVPNSGNFNSLVQIGNHGFQQILEDGLTILVDGLPVDAASGLSGSEITIRQTSYFLDPNNPTGDPVARVEESWSITESGLLRSNQITWLGSYAVDASYLISFTPSRTFSEVSLDDTHVVDLTSTTGAILRFDMPDAVRWSSDYGDTQLTILSSNLPDAGMWRQRDGTGTVVQGKGYAGIADDQQTADGDVWAMSGQFDFTADGDLALAVAAPFTVAENTVITGLMPEASDPENDPVTITIAETGDGALFVLTADGMLEFAAAPDFEAPGDLDGDNIYDIELIADDGTSQTVQALQIAVEDVNEAPEFIALADASIQEGLRSTGISVAASDPEGRPLSITIAGGADAALFTIGTGGTLAFVAAPDFEMPSDADGNNIYQLEIAADDGVNRTVQAVSVTVTDRDESPVFTSANTASAAERQTATGLKVQAVDPEGKPLTYTIQATRDGSLFRLAADGSLVFASTPDFEAYADDDGDNVFHLQVAAYDGAKRTFQDITVTLVDLDDVPSFDSPEVAGIKENLLETGILATASNGVGERFTGRILPEGDGALFRVTEAGTLAFITAPDFERPGDANGDNVYLVTLQAGEGVNAAVQTIAITVTDVNPESYVTADGLIVTVEHDRTVANPIESKRTVSTADGKVISSVSVFDNGDITERQFNSAGGLIRVKLFDGDNSDKWTSREQIYRADGSALESITAYDNGTVTSSFFDLSGTRRSIEYNYGDNTGSLLFRRLSYDALGRLESDYRENTDGQGRQTDFYADKSLKATTYFDYADRYDYAAYRDNLNDDGVRTSREILYDDGSGRVINYNEDGTRGAIEIYDSNFAFG